jgi:hypothetical protein
MTTFTCEYTDTFNGEANYSWVRRATIEAPEDATRATIMRRAKAALGLTGVRMRTIRDHGDLIEARPYCMCTVMFIHEQY